jgi:site-specific DNA-cytosine methylase
MQKEFRALGITSGIGSMLIGARTAGFKILGNIDWRKYYHVKDEQGRNTFTENFPGAFFKKNYKELTNEEKKLIQGCDIAFLHPECGNFSNLRVKKGPEVRSNPGDIPLASQMIQIIQPKFFVMDNLPKALIAYNMEQWARDLPGYDLFPEWISNYNYGNCQKNRKRFFLIGALKELGFVFRPGEFPSEMILSDVIGDLPDHDIPEWNHIHFKPEDLIPSGWSAHQFLIERPGNRITFKEFQDFIKDFKPGENFTYYNKKGEKHVRPGYYKISPDRPGHVLTGGGSALDNHYLTTTLMPLTIRERARIQGCPDSFLFYPLNYMDDLHKSVSTYAAVYKQTGKFMPVEFCEFVSRQIIGHLKNEPLKITVNRCIKSNPYINENKIWYCKNVGYSDQGKACIYCWLDSKMGCPLGVYHSSETVKLAELPGGIIPQAPPESLNLRDLPGPGNPDVSGILDDRVPQPNHPIDFSKIPKISLINHRCGCEMPGGHGEIPPEYLGDTRVMDQETGNIFQPGEQDPTIWRPIPAESYFSPGCNDGQIEVVHLNQKCLIPQDYHWFDGYMKKYLGELIKPDGTYYSRLERRVYYSPLEKGHIDKTPLHISRWAIMALTKEGDWVLDPTLGAGTTAIEALRQKRNAAGMEIETDYYKIIMENIRLNNPFNMDYHIRNGDARQIEWFLTTVDKQFALIVNNPPYSGDIRQAGFGVKTDGVWDNKWASYNPAYPNLAFLKESKEYWGTMKMIYDVCIDFLAPGGYFVIGVKDMMRKKKPYPLHQYLSDLIAPRLRYIGAVILKHYPGTLHLHTYEKRTGVKPPSYQTITIFRKEEE